MSASDENSPAPGVRRPSAAPWPKVRITRGPHAGRVVPRYPSSTPGTVDVYLGTGPDEGMVTMRRDAVEDVR